MTSRCPMFKILLSMDIFAMTGRLFDHLHVFVHVLSLSTIDVGITAMWSYLHSTWA